MIPVRADYPSRLLGPMAVSPVSSLLAPNHFARLSAIHPQNLSALPLVFHLIRWPLHPLSMPSGAGLTLLTLTTHANGVI